MAGLYRLRHGYTTLVLVALMLVPLVATLHSISYRVNLISGWVLIALAIVNLPNIERRWFRAPDSHRAGGIVLGLGLVFVAWQWQIGDLWLNSQFLLYCGVVSAYPVALAWFRREGAAGLRLLFLFKLAGVLAATGLFLIGISELTPDRGGLNLLVRSPPIYRNVRHFNYDHAMALALGIAFFVRVRSPASSVAWLLLCTTVSVVLFWSGGRAAMGTLTIFFATITALAVVPRGVVVAWICAILSGAALVIVTGYADLLFLQLGKIDEGAQAMTSGRLAIWSASLSVWAQDGSSILFGFGPDAMRTTLRQEMGYPAAIQSHSAFVQVLVEFGLVGLFGFGWLIYTVGRRVKSVLLTASAPAEGRVVATLLIALAAYMLVDGILYHAIPLIFVMLMIAYLFSIPGEALVSPPEARDSHGTE